jgi:hypothetical protein
VDPWEDGGLDVLHAMLPQHAHRASKPLQLYLPATDVGIVLTFQSSDAILWDPHVVFVQYIHSYIHALKLCMYISLQARALLLPAHPAHRTQPTPLADEPCRTAQCAPHPAPAVLSSPRIPYSRRRAGVPPRTPPSLVCVHTWNYLMCPAIGGGCQSRFQFWSQRGTTPRFQCIAASFTSL